MVNTRRSFAVAAAFLATIGLVGCSSSSDATSTPAPSNPVAPSEAPAASTVVIEDNHGSIEVPVNPERVVALDNTAFDTLAAWDIKLVAAPKPLMYDLWPGLTGGDEVLDVGLHREPDLEAVIASEPDLIIGGYRFSSIYDDLKKIQPLTVETNARDGEDQISELKRQTSILGQIFNRVADADAINAELDSAVADAKAAYNGTDTVMGLLTSGGSISYVAPVTGRAVGPVFPILGLVPALELSAEDTSHGDDISVEAIAAANPEWIIVLDRDGMWPDEEGYVPAKELIEGAEALKNVPAVQKGQVIYLDNTFYLTEGIQAYTKLYRDIADAFAGK